MVALLGTYLLQLRGWKTALTAALPISHAVSMLSYLQIPMALQSQIVLP